MVLQQLTMRYVTVTSHMHSISTTVQTCRPVNAVAAVSRWVALFVRRAEHLGSRCPPARSPARSPVGQLCQAWPPSAWQTCQTRHEHGIGKKGSENTENTRNAASGEGCTQMEKARSVALFHPQAFTVLRFSFNLGERLLHLTGPCSPACSLSQSCNSTAVDFLHCKPFREEAFPVKPDASLLYLPPQASPAAWAQTEAVVLPPASSYRVHNRSPELPVLKISCATRVSSTSAKSQRPLTCAVADWLGLLTTPWVQGGISQSLKDVTDAGEPVAVWSSEHCQATAHKLD